jgi:hypothetical protein
VCPPLGGRENVPVLSFRHAQSRLQPSLGVGAGPCGLQVGERPGAGREGQNETDERRADRQPSAQPSGYFVFLICPGGGVVFFACPGGVVAAGGAGAGAGAGAGCVGAAFGVVAVGGL